jgi:hypothetical protein
VQVGDLVELLDHDGNAHDDCPAGIVTGFDNKRGRVHVYWSAELHHPGASWGWGQLKVINGMQVGDLVKHKKNGHLGLITKIEYAADGHDPMHYIWWTDGAKGACWKNEIEVINASR